jgi:YesN/AraC family two-component response regulator
MMRVVLAEDHNTVREGIKLLVNAQTDMEVVGEAADGAAAIKKVREMQPDVLVMDISMP